MIFMCNNPIYLLVGRSTYLAITWPDSNTIVVVVVQTSHV